MAMVDYPEEVHLVVGGYHYYLDTDDVLKHPDSYFAHLLKDEWTNDKTAAVTLDRNGKVFRYISYYLFTGYMDPNCKPICDLDVLLALRTEADFYGLEYLVRLCDERIKFSIDRVIDEHESLGLNCFCVRASEEKMTDALVTAMDIFRPATTAIARLETHTTDSLESFYRSASEYLQSEQQSRYSPARKCSIAHKCFRVSEHGFSKSTISNLYDAFSKWPKKMNKRVSRAYVALSQVYIYETEGYCARREPRALGYHDRHDGAFLYIFNAEHTGGRITTKVNGEEVSIELPGECMALLPGCSYSVETVTSGQLVLLEYSVRLHMSPEEEDEKKEEFETHNSNVDGDSGSTKKGDGKGEGECDVPLVWQVHGSHSTEITPERSANLTQAIDTALLTYDGVVICLSTYYPTGHSTNRARRCETDPALLKRFDADLHAHLSTLYEVTVVTVVVNADGATEKESSYSTARVLDFPHDASMRLKVVAPMQSVSLDRGRSKTMLLTGLLCFARDLESGDNKS